MALDYKIWLKTAQDRLEELKETRNEINKEIGKLEAGIKAFSPLIEEGPPQPVGTEMGLTEAIRQIFIESNRSPLAPTGIRDELLRRGFALEQENPLAGIHQILARLVDRHFAEKVRHQGKTYYRWRGTITISDMMSSTFAERLAAQFEAHGKELAVGKRKTSIGEMMMGTSGKPTADFGKKK